MQHTLIAVFDNPADAERARDALRAAGFTDAQVRQDGAAGVAPAAAGAADTQHESGHHFGASIRHFFADLFGADDNAESSRYNAAVARGQHVLTLVATSEHEIERAANIVEQHGPVDIDEETGGRFVGGAAAPLQGAGLSQQSAAPQVQSQHGQSQHGQSQQGQSQQRAEGKGTILPAIEEALRSGSQAVKRSGVRVYQRLVDAPSTGTLAAGDAAAPTGSENYFRQHYLSTYGSSGRSYDDYLPAYGYGMNKASEAGYRGRAWNEVEAELQRDWEAEHPGSAWEHFKAAVRHGWEKITA